MKLAQQINKVRDDLRKASSRTIEMAADAYVIAGNGSGLKKAIKVGDVLAEFDKAALAGRRYRILRLAAEQIENTRALLWELPGVDWAEKHGGTTVVKRQSTSKRK
jgi:hypothetical protein